MATTTPLRTADEEIAAALAQYGLSGHEYPQSGGVPVDESEYAWQGQWQYPNRQRQTADQHVGLDGRVGTDPSLRLDRPRDAVTYLDPPRREAVLGQPLDTVADYEIARVRAEGGIEHKRANFARPDGREPEWFHRKANPQQAWIDTMSLETALLNTRLGRFQELTMPDPAGDMPRTMGEYGGGPVRRDGDLWTDTSFETRKFGGEWAARVPNPSLAAAAPDAVGFHGDAETHTTFREDTWRQKMVEELAMPLYETVHYGTGGGNAPEEIVLRTQHDDVWGALGAAVVGAGDTDPTGGVTGRGREARMEAPLARSEAYVGHQRMQPELEQRMPGKEIVWNGGADNGGLGGCVDDLLGTKDSTAYNRWGGKEEARFAQQTAERLVQELGLVGHVVHDTGMSTAGIDVRRRNPLFVDYDPVGMRGELVY